MADNSSPDYKSRLKELEERYKQAELRRKQAEEEARRAEEEARRAEEEARRAEEGARRAEEEARRAEEGARRAEERIRPTTLVELMRHTHNLLSQPLRVARPSCSTAGTIPRPTGKYCPTRLVPWTDCSEQQLELYKSVYNYLQLAPAGAPHLFSSLHELERLGRRLCRKPMGSEQQLEAYERFAIEEHVHDIITELCKIPAAREEFGLGDGIEFTNHTNALDEDEDAEVEADTSQPSTVPRPRPDSFCIHRVSGDTTTLLTSVEYKPPHKLPVAILRMGLRPMNLWKHLVKSNKIPTDQEAKLRYNAERLACSAIVQEYHVMIQEGLQYSYVTNGIARVFLRVPEDDPSTLYYFFCDPSSEVDTEATSQLWKTSVARTLCFCLMAFGSPTRGQEWRNSARSELPLWTTSFSHTRSRISRAELKQTYTYSDSTAPEYTSPESGSDYEPPSSPPGSTTIAVRTRSQTGCAPSGVRHRSQSPDSSGSDSNQATGRKRGLSQITSSPSTQRVGRQRVARNNPSNQASNRDAQFCTQRCLLGMQSGGILDDCCPNVMLHRRSKDDPQHPITSEDLVRLLKAQLDENIDRCTPLGGCGGYGAPFKLTCTIYGYTVVGKGTTSRLWEEVSREAQVYRILRKAQGSAVPVFLGSIDLAKIYFLHGAGEIRHMLVMGWGGESTAKIELTPCLHQEIRRSEKEIRSLGIIHEDLRPANILWNQELGRALIIDFHRVALKARPISQRQRTAKRRPARVETGGVKRLRAL